MTCPISPYVAIQFSEFLLRIKYDDFSKWHCDGLPVISKTENGLGGFAVPPADVQQIEYARAVGLLVARELDVLREVARGKQREAIASSLGIGAESVKTHLKGIMTKLGCPNATSAVSRAYELGILRA